jgi:two-component system chemotaxis sensor kinase CheA
LLELVRLELADAEKSIERIQGAPVYRLRGRLLPLVYLSQVLQSKSNVPSTSDCINIVVLRVDDRQFGLVVDRINDTEEIVVKPMGKQLKGVPVFAGATIMGDGKVALILDVLGIAHLSNVLSKDRNRAHADSSLRAKEPGLDNQTLLVLGTGNNRRLALPISQVARLEKIPLESIEYTDNQEVVQYRGTILPLIRLAKHFGIKDTETPVDGLLNVVVYRENDCNYGLVVHRVIDIVEAACEISRSSQRKGLLGSAIIHGHVTDLVDLPAVIKQLVTKTKISSRVCY